MLDMRIEDYRITSDSRNIVLSKVRRDEEGNIRYTSIDKAQQIAKSIESKTSYRTALNQREEFLLEVGYKKEKFIG